MKKSCEQLEKSVNFYRALMVVLLIVIATAVFTLDVQEEEINKLEGDNKVLVVENNKLKFQLQKQCNADIETVIELERVIKEMSGE